MDHVKASLPRLPGRPAGEQSHGLLCRWLRAMRLRSADWLRHVSRAKAALSS